MDNAKTPRVEVDFYESIVCPICAQTVMAQPDETSDEPPPLTPCEHTLFIAHDVGYEYRSTRFDAVVGDEEDASFDQSGIPGAVIHEAYQPAPSFFGIYAGFAPI